MTSLVGAGPIVTGTSGAPGGSVPWRATQGFPAADPESGLEPPAVAVDVDVAVDVAVEIPGWVEVVAPALTFAVFRELEPHAETMATSTTTTPAIRAVAFR